MRRSFLVACTGALLASVLPLTASAQTPDPFAGLSPSVLAIAHAIDSGSVGSITAYLPASGATETSYPGDGFVVSQDTAVAHITAAIVSNATASDAVGSGAYRLIAIWIPNAQPDQVFLAGSGIDSTGTRITTIFTVAKDGQTILAYGRAVDTDATFRSFGTSGDLRLVASGTAIPGGPAAPGAPNTGTGQSANRGAEAVWLAASLLIALGGAALVASRRRAIP